jgi:hypothetical protein
VTANVPFVEAAIPASFKYQISIRTRELVPASAPFTRVKLRPP